VHVQPPAPKIDLRLAKQQPSPSRRRLLRPTHVEIDLDALVDNLAQVRADSPQTAVMAVVKANAYGHGAVACGMALERAGADMLGVALVEEGLELRDAGVRLPIVVIGGTYEGAFDLVVESDLTPVVYRADHVEAFSASARGQHKTVSVHLKLDTGMGRIGARLEEVPELLASLARAPELSVEGVMSHFANADQADQEMNRLQLERFRKAMELIERAGLHPHWRHLSNSAGVLGLPGAHDGELCNLVRPGLMLYGESPVERSREAAHLRPVLSWKTKIIHLKKVQAGTPISYGGKWNATRESVIATLPVGYADGYSRKLTNAGEVLVRGQRAHIAGTVCMDMCMVDVTHVPNVAIGDEVVLLGQQGDERVSAQEIAGKVGTISYEIFSNISARVPRVVMGTGG
jgi:alanine racemase